MTFLYTQTEKQLYSNYFFIKNYYYSFILNSNNTISLQVSDTNGEIYSNQILANISTSVLEDFKFNDKYLFLSIAGYCFLFDISDLKNPNFINSLIGVSTKNIGAFDAYGNIFAGFFSYNQIRVYNESLSEKYIIFTSGNVNDIVIFNNFLIACTTAGIFIYSYINGSYKNVSSYSQTFSEAYKIIIYENYLIILNTNGASLIYDISNLSSISFHSNFSTIPNLTEYFNCENYNNFLLVSSDYEAVIYDLSNINSINNLFNLPLSGVEFQYPNSNINNNQFAINNLIYSYLLTNNQIYGNYRLNSNPDFSSLINHSRPISAIGKFKS